MEGIKKFLGVNYMQHLVEVVASSSNKSIEYKYHYYHYYHCYYHQNTISVLIIHDSRQGIQMMMMLVSSYYLNFISLIP